MSRDDAERMDDNDHRVVSDSGVAKEATPASKPNFEFPENVSGSTIPCHNQTGPVNAHYQHVMVNNPPYQLAASHPLLYFFESQMRGHLAAFEQAAAGAAWVTAQIAADVASASTATNAMHYPVAPQLLPRSPYMFLNVPMTHPYQVPQHATTQFVRPHTQPQSEVNVDRQYEEDALYNSSSSECIHRRRKRQQRGPPSTLPNGKVESGSFSHLSPLPSGRRRRRSRNSRSLHSESQSSWNYAKSRRRNRRVELTSSGSDGGNAYNITKKKKRQPEPDNSSLLGKTGVAALYVFCEKRRTTPHFQLKDRHNERLDPKVGMEDFEIVVSVDGHECGHGHGKNKSGAKQEAARVALQSLLPGVEFDKASGILINLPKSTVSQKKIPNPLCQREAATTAEELAPNLAKLLAIGRESEIGNQSSRITTLDADETRAIQRRKHVYPETSTTSEEDEDTYYASRGASVCSALLHAMVQIDERIPEPPVYTYHVSAVGPTMKHKHRLKRKAGGPLCSPSVIHRGSFNCTGTMGVEVSNPDPGKPSFDIIQAIGIGGTKREARHRAAAKLLARLFPECEGMVAVKQAAEAFREKYAAEKALKQQTKRRRPCAYDNCSNRQPLMSYNHKGAERPRDYNFALAPGRSTVFSVRAEHILCALECTTQKDELSVISSDGPSKSRQRSRQEQLDSAVSLALQKLNEHDVEGRSLPDELSVDDVGRTVLRRSTLADVHWIMDLIEDDEQLLSPLSPLGRTLNGSKHAVMEIGDEFDSSLLRRWLSSSVVLLLCRAIAPFEDPPLGCAALTLGFSMEKGCTMRITRIASKSHLPRERFIEVLQSFSREMSSILELPKQTQSCPKKINCEDIEHMLQSHLEAKSVSQVSSNEKQPPLSTRLQSVQEEIEDCSDCLSLEIASEKRNSKQGQVKPSKRSRVQ